MRSGSCPGVTYPLEDVRDILERLLHAPAPAGVDSMCVAGLLELHRTAGVWVASVRYGYAYGALASAGNLAEHLDQMWSRVDLDRLAKVFETEWQSVVDNPQADMEAGTKRASNLRAIMESQTISRIMADLSLCRLIDSKAATRVQFSTAPSGPEPTRVKFSTAPSGPEPSDVVTRFVSVALDAFFKQDLLTAARQLLAGSIGSFGLVLSTSVDAKRELVVAARGQTMSIAFYPMLGMILWGSEAAATKAGIGAAGADKKKEAATDAPKAVGAKSPSRWGKVRHVFKQDEALQEGFRFDLDDVNGEVALLRWGEEAEPPMVPAARRDGQVSTALEPMVQVMDYDVAESGRRGALWIAQYVEGTCAVRKPFFRRVLQLGDNPYVSPIPQLGGEDPVGRDLADLNSVLQRIHDDWHAPEESMNKLSAFTLQRELRKRMIAHERGEHDGSVDLLIAGCEVSLWVGEQFAADLHKVFPKLRIVTLSANKLLGQLGQGYPTPQTGFAFHETSHDFSDCCALLISHSGGTFATLNVANLLKGFTSTIFCVTSEWDTQVARAVRSGPPGISGTVFKPGFKTGKPTVCWSFDSYVFVTLCGMRPAEPCSLTVAATHQVLTQILLYLMESIRYYEPNEPHICGATYHTEEVRELETLNVNTLGNLRALAEPSDGTRRELIAQGERWAQHVLEGPIAWILCATYIMITVTVGYTPLSTSVLAIRYGVTGQWGWESAHADPVKYVVGVIDAVIYTFLPWWMTILLRLVQVWSV